MAEDWIVFIDTNVLLDFYRQGGESVSRQTDALIKHKDRIITGDQVRMEFLKNRQKVIKQGAGLIPKPESFTPPAMVVDSQPSQSIKKRLLEIKEQKKKLSERFGNILSKPAQYDPVFKAVRVIFDFNGVYNLRRPDPLRFTIRNLARKRFALGYPPRKNSDVSIGDAINWEWIIHCAQNSPSSTGIYIVTRDEDFGVFFDNKMHLNDWLYREFRDRVSKRKEIKITAKLSDAIRALDEAVDASDEKEEEKIIEKTFSDENAGEPLDQKPIDDLLNEIIKNMI